jgi:hypothetical protein
MALQWGYDRVLVIAPPRTHLQWKDVGVRLGVTVETMSHATFRMKKTLLSRSQAIIADEFHLFGGHGGQGWVKLDRLAQHLQAPLILASATPNYNDAERVYCIQHVLDPSSCRGGYLEFLYRHCETEQNPFSTTPIVTGFKNFAEAKDYLAALPHVHYLPDDVIYQIHDFNLPVPKANVGVTEILHIGYNRFKHKMIASQMEERHALAYQTRVCENGLLRDEVADVVLDMLRLSSKPKMIYCNHATIAVAAFRTLMTSGVDATLITGETSSKGADAAVARFKRGETDVLVGTASLATGTDGLDKVSDLMIILDDTDDDSLRRQIVGRILPRGADTDASMKQFHRINLIT